MAASVASAKGAAGAGQERLCPISGGGRWCILPKSKDPEAVRPKKVFGAYWPRGTAGKDPEADGGPDDKFSLAPLTQRHRRCQSDAAAMTRLRRRELHRLVQRKLRAWTRRLRAWTWPGCVRETWPGSPSQKVAGPDEGQVDSMRLELHKVGARSRVWRRGGYVCGRGPIPLRWRRMYKAISAIETSRRRWILRSKRFERRDGGRRRSSQQVEVIWSGKHFRWARIQRWKHAFQGKCEGDTSHVRVWHVEEGHRSKQVRVFRCDRGTSEYFPQ